MDEHIDLQRNIQNIKNYCEKNDPFRHAENYDIMEDPMVKMTCDETCFIVTYLPGKSKPEGNRCCVVNLNQESSNTMREVKSTVDFIKAIFNNSRKVPENRNKASNSGTITYENGKKIG